jgi:VWFA-related protein
MLSPISARISLLVCFVLSAAFASSGQAPTPTPFITEDDVVVKVESRLVVVPVSVVDANGDPVLGLTANNFRILEENRQQVIDSVGNAENVPLEIALLFDVSASTDAMFTFQQDTAAKFLREVLRPEDRATIFTIGQTPMLVQGREGVEKAIEAVMKIRPTKGATAFYDTVRAAADYLKVNSPSGRRRVILVISDGEDNFSDGVQRAQRAAERRIADNRPDPELKRLGKVIVQAQQSAKNSERVRVLRSLQDADIVHYSINPGGSSYLLNQISIFGQENMQIFSDETGGTAFVPRFAPIDTKDYLQNAGNSRKNTEALERIFRQLANELRAQYLIQYYSESNFPDGRFVKLSVGLNGRTDLRVRARQGYYVKRPE